MVVDALVAQIERKENDLCSFEPKRAKTEKTPFLARRATRKEKTRRNEESLAQPKELCLLYPYTPPE